MTEHTATQPMDSVIATRQEPSSTIVTLPTCTVELCTGTLDMVRYELATLDRSRISQGENVPKRLGLILPTSASTGNDRSDFNPGRKRFYLDPATPSSTIASPTPAYQITRPKQPPLLCPELKSTFFHNITAVYLLGEFIPMSQQNTLHVMPSGQWQTTQIISTQVKTNTQQPITRYFKPDNYS
jgi:hypothetical protein